MVFGVSPYAQTARLDGGKAVPDGLAQGGRVDVRDAILLADAAVGKVESLAGDVSVGVGRVVAGEPGGMMSHGMAKREKGGAYGLPCLDEDLFGAIRGAGRRGRPDVGGELLEGVIAAHVLHLAHPGVLLLLLVVEHRRVIVAVNDGARCEHGMVIGGIRCGQVHRDVLRL